MNKLIPQQEYYVSDSSKADALKRKRVRRFIGEDTKGNLWFESGLTPFTVRERYAVPIPKPEYVPWDAKTRPLGGAYKRKYDGVIFVPSAYTENAIRAGVEWYGFNQLLKEFDYIPDLTKEHETVPCGVLEDG